MVMVRVRAGAGVKVRIVVRFRSEICKLCMQEFEIARHILQVV